MTLKVLQTRVLQEQILRLALIKNTSELKTLCHGETFCHQVQPDQIWRVHKLSSTKGSTTGSKTANE